MFTHLKGHFYSVTTCHKQQRLPTRTKALCSMETLQGVMHHMVWGPPHLQPKKGTIKKITTQSIETGNLFCAYACREHNGKGSNQESKFDFVATSWCLVKIDEGQQKIKIYNQIVATKSNFDS